MLCFLTFGDTKIMRKIQLRMLSYYTEEEIKRENRMQLNRRQLGHFVEDFVVNDQK